MPRNTSNTAVSGATWRYGTILGGSFIVLSLYAPSPHPCLPPPGGKGNVLRRHELVPLADHMAVFVHDGVPAGDLPHTFPERPAVTHMAGVLHVIAIGVL